MDGRRKAKRQAQQPRSLDKTPREEYIPTTGTTYVSKEDVPYYFLTLYQHHTSHTPSPLPSLHPSHHPPITTQSSCFLAPMVWTPASCFYKNERQDRVESVWLRHWIADRINCNTSPHTAEQLSWSKSQFTRQQRKQHQR